jgi:hypothetical protein
MRGRGASSRVNLPHLVGRTAEGPKTPIQGPAGIEAAFELHAAFNAAAGRMMTVTLRNGVASYA